MTTAESDKFIFGFILGMLLGIGLVYALNALIGWMLWNSPSF